MKQFFAALVSLAVSAVSAQGVPIKIGEINSYSSMTQFTAR